MATKFFKNLFSSSDKSKKRNDLSVDLDKAEGGFSTDPKRKLSISRSGRMKQQSKKRASLGNNLFGEDGQKAAESSVIEYHVHGKKFNKNDQADNNNTGKDLKLDLKKDHGKSVTKSKSRSKSTNHLGKEADAENAITPEEAKAEIEKAFEVVESAM